MSELKRRRLGGNNPKGPQNRSENRNENSPQPQSQPHGRSRPQQNQRSSPQQGQQAQQGPRTNTHPHHRRHRRPQAPRPAPPPPAYFQRDLLLLCTSGAQGIETVRAKLDPLAKKIPAHVTLIFPEPAKMVSDNLLKDISSNELPSLTELQFSQVVIHDEMYLWLVPDAESKTKILKWQETLLTALKIENHSQDEFNPHITLGYIPRSLTAEDAIAFAHTHISLPINLNFERLILEEFSENQVSKVVDSLAFSSDTPQPDQNPA